MGDERVKSKGITIPTKSCITERTGRLITRFGLITILAHLRYSHTHESTANLPRPSSVIARKFLPPRGFATIRPRFSLFTSFASNQYPSSITRLEIYPSHYIQFGDAILPDRERKFFPRRKSFPVNLGRAWSYLGFLLHNLLVYTQYSNFERFPEKSFFPSFYLVASCSNRWGGTQNLTLNANLRGATPPPVCLSMGFLRFNQSSSPFAFWYLSPK